MFAVIFEVKPRRQRWDDYLGLARRLRPELEKIRGFVANERFASLRDRSWVLSLSTWTDEKALIRWRTLPLHHEAQERGRREIFKDYHLRVGEVIGDSDGPPIDLLAGQRFDGTEVGIAPILTVTIAARPAGSESAPPHDLITGLDSLGVDTASRELFESITEPGKLLLLQAWRDPDAAQEWERMRRRQPVAAVRRDLRVRIIRDYGMTDRREAPQFYPPLG